MIDLACHEPDALGMAAEPWTPSAWAEQVASLDALGEHILEGIAEMNAYPVRFQRKSFDFRMGYSSMC